MMEFNSDRKSMSVIVNAPKIFGTENNVILLKGAPERIIAKCSKVRLADGTDKELSQSDKDAMNKVVQTNAKEALRMLALAIIPDGGAFKSDDENSAISKLEKFEMYNEYESGGVFLGMVGIKDPVRSGVAESIAACKTAGIRVMMITGDQKDTAQAIAKEIDIIDDFDLKNRNCVFTGEEFEKLSDADKKHAMRGDGGLVFSRVEPRHKRQIVKQLIELDQIVAMTGDGVNDAPALKQAHIGIAMGITGTEVAKEASDMILADDNFATIVKAVEEGRAIFSNMKAFIRYLISSNIGEVASIFLTAMLGIPESFSSVQLLWVNLVTDGPPATALGFNPPDTDIMVKPPRKSNDALISGWVLFRYMVVGMYVGFATVGIFAYWYMYANTGDGHTLLTW